MTCLINEDKEKIKMKIEKKELKEELATLRRERVKKEEESKKQQ